MNGWDDESFESEDLDADETLGGSHTTKGKSKSKNNKMERLSEAS
jgi:hypothetical protein